MRTGAENAPAFPARTCGSGGIVGRRRDELGGAENLDPGTGPGRRKGRQQRSQSVGSAGAVGSGSAFAAPRPGGFGSCPGNPENGPAAVRESSSGVVLRRPPEHSRSFSIGSVGKHGGGVGGGGTGGGGVRRDGGHTDSVFSLAAESVIPVPVVLPPLLLTTVPSAASRTTSVTAPASEPESPGNSSSSARRHFCCDGGLVMAPLPDVMDHQQLEASGDGDGSDEVSNSKNGGLLSDHDCSAAVPPENHFSPSAATVVKKADPAAADGASTCETKTGTHRNMNTNITENTRTAPSTSVFGGPNVVVPSSAPCRLPCESHAGDRRRSDATARQGVDGVDSEWGVSARVAGVKAAEDGSVDSTAPTTATRATRKFVEKDAFSTRGWRSEGAAAGVGEPAFRRPEYVVKMCLTLYKVRTYPVMIHCRSIIECGCLFSADVAPTC